MDKLNLEKFKEDKIEYDKKIRSLDYMIVETSVEMYNARSRNFQFYQEMDYVDLVLICQHNSDLLVKVLLISLECNFFYNDDILHFYPILF